MKVNIEFLVVSYFISLFVDWVFQWQWQAVNKSKWGKGDNFKLSYSALITHSFAYSFFTVLFTNLILVLNNRQQAIAILVLFISHIIIDSRIPVKWIMKFKGLTEEQIRDYQTYGFMHIGIDHRLHEITLLILALVV